MELVLSFFERLYSILLQNGEEDRLGWSPSKRGKLGVKSFYKVLTSHDGPSFPWSIWRVKAPLRGSIFCVDNRLSENFDT